MKLLNATQSFMRFNKTHVGIQNSHSDFTPAFAFNMFQFCDGLLTPMQRRNAHEPDAFYFVSRGAFANVQTPAQVPVCLYVPLRRCKAVQSHSLHVVLLNTPPTRKHDAQVLLSGGKPLVCCKAVQSRSLSIILLTVKAISQDILAEATARSSALLRRCTSFRCNAGLPDCSLPLQPL